jgi:phosphate transport system protein
MMRVQFQEQLSQLDNMLIEMGALVETAIAASVKTLKRQDAGIAREAIAISQDVMQQERDIESLCLKLLLQQHPVAKDLRLISAALKMITDMARIGDQAADIAGISVTLADTPPADKSEHIVRMAEATAKMVTDSIDAFVKKDVALAQAVIAYDDVVDHLFYQVKNDLIDMIRSRSESGEQAIDLMMVAKYLERIGDHVVNLAQWAVFSITGLRARELEDN